MKKKLLVFSLILVLFVSACGVAKSESTMNVEMPAAVMDWGNDAAVSSYDFVEESAAESYLETDEAGGQERMVIQTATMRVSVADTVEAMNATTALAKSMGGYVVSSDRYSDTTYNKVTYTRTSITIRVPAAKLEEAMQKIREMSADGKNGVLSESLSGEDVTSDFVDSSSRLRNLKAAEEQLVRLMENTDDLDATMSVFRELTNIRSEIEVLEGHIKYLQESSALSSISVDFVAEASLQPIEIGGWKLEGVAKDALENLIRMFQDLVDFLIRFSIQCLPFLIPLGVGLYFLTRAIKKSAAKRRARKAEEAVKPEESLIVDEESLK
jgi:hypothetical protein